MGNLDCKGLVRDCAICKKVVRRTWKGEIFQPPEICFISQNRRNNDQKIVAAGSKIENDLCISQCSKND